MTAPYSMQPQPYRSGMKKLSDPMANTGAPGGPQMGGGLNMGGGWADSPVPKFDPSGFKPNFGSSANPGGMSGWANGLKPPNPGVAQVNMQGQASQGGFPVMTGGTGAWERNTALGDAQTPSQFTRGGAGGTSTFSKDSNLINSQFNPTPGLRTLNAQGATDQAKQNYSGYNFQGFNAQGPLNDSKSRDAITGANDKTQSMSSMGYRPVAGTDLSGARNYLAQAGANLGPSSAASGLVGPGATGSVGYNGDTGAVRGQTQAQLNKVLNTTPDRQTLAANNLNRMIADTEPQFQTDLRNVGKKAAALGRVGAGMTTSDLGDVSQRRNEQIVRRGAELADSAAGLSLQDEQDKLNAARGVTTDFGGLDTAAGSLNLGYQNSANAERGSAFDRARALGNDTFGRTMDLSNAEMKFGQIGRSDALDERDAERTSYLDRNNVLGEQAQGLRNMGSDLYGMDSDAWNRGVSERDKGLNYDQRMFDNRRNIFGDMATDEQRLTGNDRADRTEMRGERDYQYGLSRDATNDAVQQRMLEEQLLDSRFRRGQGLFGAGYSQSPVGTYGQQADSFGADAAASYGAMGDLFGSSVLNKRRPNAQASYNGSF